MGQSYQSYAGSDLGADVFTVLAERTDTLRSSFSGASHPASPVVGQFHLEDAGAVDDLWIYCDQTGGDAWRHVALQRLTFDLNFDPDTAEGRGATTATKQALGMRFENLGTHPVTLAAGNKGMVWFYTGGSENRPYFSDGTSRMGFLHAKDDATTGSFDDVPVEVSALWLDATNPPTLKALGNAVGWLFDATNEKAALLFRVPKSYRQDGDLTVRLLVWLDAAETANDLIEWQGTVRAVTPGVDAIDKTATTIATSTKDVVAVTGAGSLFECDLTIDFDDATNPVAAGDLLVVTINRVTVGGAGKVGGTVLAKPLLLYRQKSIHEKA